MTAGLEFSYRISLDTLSCNKRLKVVKFYYDTTKTLEMPH